MKKDKEKSLLKKAKKNIRKSLEEQLTAEITKSIISQGKDPKKVTKELKRAVSLIAKKLAKREGISKEELTNTIQAEADVTKDEVNSFKVAPVTEKKVPTPRKTRTSSKNKTVNPEAATPPIIRKRAPRKTVAKATEPATEPSPISETENN